MTINIICFGKLSSEWQNIFNQYARKIHNVDINVIELKEIIVKNIEHKKDEETKLLISKLPKNCKNYLLDIQGESIDSIKFSNKISYSNINFIIGGSNGVNKNLFKNVELISFSKLTFPHELFRVMLIEQIYRGIKIKENSNYHK
ncbi:23S rRNA (pseudouridine(1915)-N(3))-methyltransferase RlmH [Mycoplasma phocimorsus]|uniref:Ribosomal RNA large subunit methyltransferase H n=1 Tax=Mycoplasma phocimorsus TaxID=3045839 RepID=A0AAJ1PS58_9MOLU|nr:23S rRNA (pseudouridine(1915)-N(3))-methyltransferase RlmH [Mycoplasma phocimorsus]MDJ1645783.1 23S rRNA (pseudouridine(1915)-N(3))-methyltransferase RlmH [Mycoplasma phocimorsus]MDJ1646497.1 23S rRNA (pseudouridine(1915)-N(3))-methyltransferase RlmH [Mycoplasma phocimorsus]MDJ1646942.1 23S rRNA (pseudouridine(1915)-N(3))-methyltransferase RlmH [Mycoplasma phocimorsus]MDJ1648358.1 23S rRNA (pseudouridine(1915)-N(3))-methyltransferase RlmH [Mycoplasma phocimorsus]MDJ1648907.1 23S rRNA (pseud